MATEIKAPVFPESIADGTVATWHKQVGQPCKRDELLVDIETDKVVLEVVAPDDGVLVDIVSNEGQTVEGEQIIAHFQCGAAGSDSESSAPPAEAEPLAGGQKQSALLGPAARKAANEHGVDPSTITGSGKGGRVTEEDVLEHVRSPRGAAQANSTVSAPSQPAAVAALPVGERLEKRVPMTRLRAKVAERLVEAQQTAAMLTTFNEVDMKPVMDLRRQYKDKFEKRHGVRLGFMSFFVKAAVEALRRQPAVNASIDGNDIVYHGYQDIGVAVSSDRGLVVPVLRNAQDMGLAQIESTIREYGAKAAAGKLGIDDMTGGTFTISNGGVFGSLLSTPILNPPQAAILGMHKIQERPVVVDGAIAVRPMMFLALSYDHRLLDGKEAVTFLVTIKEFLEDPARMLLDI